MRMWFILIGFWIKGETSTASPTNGDATTGTFNFKIAVLQLSENILLLVSGIGCLIGVSDFSSCPLHKKLLELRRLNT